MKRRSQGHHSKGRERVVVGEIKLEGTSSVRKGPFPPRAFYSRLDLSLLHHQACRSLSFVELKEHDSRDELVLPGTSWSDFHWDRGIE